MADSKTLFVVIAVLSAGLMVSATFAAFYLFRYDQAQNDANTYLNELKQAAATVQTTTSTLVVGGETTTVTSSATVTGGFVATTNILLDFGNGTQRWYNGTQVQPGWNVYLATVVITNGNLNETWYPQYGEHLVQGIDGVQGSATSSWFLWSYNSTSLWQVAQSGADQLPASDGSVYAWSYCGLTPTYALACAAP